MNGREIYYSMEDYFQQVSKLGSSIQDQAYGSGELMKSHGMEVVGPPLKF